MSGCHWAKNPYRVGFTTVIATSGSKMAEASENLSNTLVPQPANVFLEARRRLNLSQKELAEKLNTSLFALVRWERGDLEPSAEILDSIRRLSSPAKERELETPGGQVRISFESNGIGTLPAPMPLFDNNPIALAASARPSLLSDIMEGDLWGDGRLAIAEILARSTEAAKTIDVPLDEPVSAGKNTYTYDAHTYHTKVPPQGIATVMSRYLPDGGVVLDPFAGSGMTGVAARYLGLDVVLNELSPAASFIAHNFTKSVNPTEFNSAISQVLENLADLRSRLYSTKCRECDARVEAHFVVWSYKLRCSHCDGEFVLWDHCRKYGRTVREHKLLRQFPCPHCKVQISKSFLPRLEAAPVFLGYRCCKKKIVEHPLGEADYSAVTAVDDLMERYRDHMPTATLPDGVNLKQPKRHGLLTIKDFYTQRNLIACAALWKETKRIEDPDLAASVGFVFTSLYQRVTRLSEYRFWGGSGNTANFNVPQIFNETNVFLTFERKAKSIADHFVTTAAKYRGRCAIRTGSATDLSFLPDSSVDFIFTDPPFGGNINYSEMNILWEAWLGCFTEPDNEAIVNRVQGKSVDDYERLMAESLVEAYRVLRPNHWMVLVFMNSSEKVWRALRRAILKSGFSIEKVSIFDKQHGTYKQFVSENAAGSDLMIHCRKTVDGSRSMSVDVGSTLCVDEFMNSHGNLVPMFPYVHVRRDAEIDFRTLYSRYIAKAIEVGQGVLGFAQFREDAQRYLGSGK